MDTGFDSKLKAYMKVISFSQIYFLRAEGVPETYMNV